jgi:hypothetical protein
MTINLGHKEGGERQSISAQVNRRPVVVKVESGESIVAEKKPAPASQAAE